MEKESNGELPFLDTLLKRINRNISVLVYRKPVHNDQYLTTALTTKQVARKVLFPPCLIEHVPLPPINMT